MKNAFRKKARGFFVGGNMPEAAEVRLNKLTRHCMLSVVGKEKQKMEGVEM